MSSLPIFSRMMTDHRRRMLLTILGIGFVTLLYMSVYPQIADTDALTAQMEAYPEEMLEALNMQNIADGPGYAQATIFGLLGMVILMVVSVALAVRVLAGAEASGSLELTIAHGVSRSRVLWERFLAYTLWVLLVAAAIGVVVYLLGVAYDMDIGLSGAVGAAMGLAGLVVLCGSVSLAAGAATGRPGVALAAGATVAVFAYAANSMLVRVSETFRIISPYHWAYGADPLRNGPDWGGIALLGVTSVVVVALSTIALNRRDIKAG